MSKAFFFMAKSEEPTGGTGSGREAWMPHTGDGYYDKNAKMYFGTKRSKQQWLVSGKMRETGELYSKKWYDEKCDDPRRIIEGTGGASNRFKGVGR